MPLNPLQVYLKHYNARLFPCRKRRFVGDDRSKSPLFDGWQSKDYSAKELLAFWEAGHPIAWALGVHDLVIDVDAPSESRPDKKGPESLKILNRLLGQSLASVGPVVQTSHGGAHYYLTIDVPEGKKLRAAIKELPGIDVKSYGGYVIVAGSEHWLGGSYNFSPETDLGDYGRRECPPVLLDLILRDDKVTQTESAQVSGDLLKRLLNCLDQQDYRVHDQWFPIFAASHQATGGSAEGLAVFEAWCADDPKFEKRNIRYRWTTLAAKASGGVTIGTLFSAVDEAGFDDVVQMVRASIEFGDVDETGLFDDEGDGLPDYEPIVFDPKPVDGGDPTAPKKKKKKKRIKYELDEVEVNRKVIAELAKMPNLFQRSAHLVTISNSEILTLNPLGICEQISSVCELGAKEEIKVGPEKGEYEWKAKRVPERVGKQIDARGSWFGVRRLKMVANIPMMTAGGILQTQGYDVLSGVFYAKTIDVPRVKTNPTRTDAVEASRRLFDIVQDFPFKTLSHRSAWLASLLAVLARPAIDGPVPMTFIDGNQRGVGKGLLTDLVYLILFGDNMPKHASMPKDEAEMSKTLLSIAIRNQPTYNFDNVPSGSRIGSPSLDSVLTNGTVAGRILGKSEVHDYPIETVFFGSGNRISVDKNTDIIRRLNYICLQTAEEKAENRSDFKHGGEAELRQYAKGKRPELIHAALTILEHSRTSKEKLKLKPWGSYEAFSAVVRRAIVLIGEPDPITTREDLESRDETHGELEIVIAALEDIGALSFTFGKTAAEIIAELSDSMFCEDDAASKTRYLAAQLLAPTGTASPTVRCGQRLSKQYRDQACSGRWIKKQIDPAKKINVFWVEDVKNEDSELF